MSDIDALCAQFEGMDQKTFDETLVKRSSAIMQVLTAEAGKEDAMAAFIDFVLCAIAADEVLTEREFLLVKPFLDPVLGRDVTFEEAEKKFREYDLHKPDEYKKTVEHMVDTIGGWNAELRDEIILLCLMICAVDGKVSEAERAWIGKLFD